MKKKLKTIVIETKISGLEITRQLKLFEAIFNGIVTKKLSPIFFSPNLKPNIFHSRISLQRKINEYFKKTK